MFSHEFDYGLKPLQCVYLIYNYFLVPDERVDSSGDEAVNEDVPQSSTANRASTAEETTPESIATDKAKQGDASESTAPNEGEEDNSDLKLAWEVLELARIICQK